MLGDEDGAVMRSVEAICVVEGLEIEDGGIGGNEVRAGGVKVGISLVRGRCVGGRPAKTRS